LTPEAVSDPGRRQRFRHEAHAVPGFEFDPALSPDGKQVAFDWQQENEDTSDIYVKLADAGSALRLTSNPADESAPAWSADGRYIALHALLFAERRWTGVRWKKSSWWPPWEARSAKLAK
jgi:dipeptidyl aminopeptidase/acylaminoacyl peptidase